MKNFMPLLLIDAYKIGHVAQYPDDAVLVYSNFTPRSSRVPGVDKVVACGFQYFVLEYLVNQFRENFFQKERGSVVKAYKRRVDNMLGPGTNVNHIGELHEMGHLPLHIKAVPEGTLLPLRVPALTIYNTHDKFRWLTNKLETLMSNVLWLPSTSATTAFRYRREFERYAKLTGASREFIPWQGHDFSMRGMAGIEAACLSGFGHLLSFTGTDTVPAIDFCEWYYSANSDTELVGGSVAATEHSVMCMGGQAGEFETVLRLVTQVYPKGIVSIVWDTWDFWKGVTDYLPRLKHAILAREGKVVIRPDSGDPVLIICGDPKAPEGSPQRSGLVRMLYHLFGGKTNAAGFIELDPHIGVIYGDSITPERQTEILGRLMNMGFASSNIVLGIGSFTYQHVTRDTFGWAMKATYGEFMRMIEGKLSRIGMNIFKKPATDDGTKNSATGLLTVWNDAVKDNKFTLRLEQEVDWHRESGGILQTIFENGNLKNLQTLAQIRARLLSQL